MKQSSGIAKNSLMLMAMNIAKERGIDLEQFAQQFGMKIK